MSDSIIIEGEEFISAKRASQITTYTRDYIGQLARSGSIIAKRVEGLWYISLNSLNKHRSKADEYKPRPPLPIFEQPEIETTVTFDGKDFISAARASKITGYHQDYVGQLARTGKIESRQVGNRWFVGREGILKHKSEKDALLAAVQTESVGIDIHKDREHFRHTGEPFFTYSLESSNDSLMPALSRNVRPQKQFYNVPSDRSKKDAQERQNSLHIRRISSKKINYEPLSQYSRLSSIKKQKTNRSKILTGSALTIILVLTFGFTSLRDKAIYALNADPGSIRAQAASVEDFTGIIQQSAEWLEDMFGHTIDYTSRK